MVDFVTESYVADYQSEIERLRNRVAELESQVQQLHNDELNILKFLPEIVFIIDLNERFVFINNSFKKIFGISEDEIPYNIHLKDILIPESLYQARKIYLTNGNKDLFEVQNIRAIRSNRDIIPLSVYFSKFYENSQHIGFIGVGYDLSERLHVEQKLTETNLTLIKFISIIAHDLRNPFNSLIGFSSLLLNNYERYSDEKKKEYVKHIWGAANNGLQLLENLLEWARASAGHIEIIPIAFEARQVIEDTVNLLEGNATKKEIDIEIEYTSPNIVVCADQNMIRTVLRNLLSNAIKFTHRGGKVILRVSQNKKQVNFEVIDNGVGIKPEHIKNLFKLNIETSTLGTEREKGTGLGLVLCHEFVALNKGLIEVESVYGKGSTFRVKLPSV